MTDDAAPTQPEPAAPVPGADDLEKTRLAAAVPAAAEPVPAPETAPPADVTASEGPAPLGAPPAVAPPAAVPSPRAHTPKGGGYRGRIRSISIGLVFFLTCLSLVLATTTWWLHDTLLATDRFVTLTAPLARDPEVQEALVEVTSTQVEEALGLGPIGSYVITGIAREVYSSDAFAELWERSMAYVHEQLVALLRGESAVIQTSDGKVVLNLFPLFDRILTKINELDLEINGTAIEVPTFTDPTDADASRAELAAAIDRELRPTFGTIAVADSAKLEAAQRYVTIFDALVVVLFVVTGLLAILTLVLARRRIRMVALLGLGSLAALLVARLIVSSAADGLATAVVEAGPGAIIGGQAVQAIADSYREFARIVLLIGLVAAVGATAAAWLLERRAGTVLGDRDLASLADGWFLALAGLTVALVTLLVVGLTAATLVLVAGAYLVWLAVVAWSRRRERAQAEAA
jgi:hypothetical protein